MSSISPPSQPSCWIGPVQRSTEGLAEQIAAGLAQVGRTPRPGERWAVKLNLTYPTYLPGVLNAPLFMEAMARWAADAGVRLTFVEGDGGNGAYSAYDAFVGNGVTGICARYGAAWASLTEGPWAYRETLVQGRIVKLPYSSFLLRREFDRFVSAPLFKNHIFTTATLGLKNLWGCIPDPYRMLYHRMLDHGIVALFKELRPDFTIVDGLIGMRGRGPMEGHPIEMGCLLVGSDCASAELAALEIMGIPLACVGHLSMASAEGLLPEQWRWMSDPCQFRRNDFIIERTSLNRLSIALAAFPPLQRIVYHSPLSRPIYAIVDRIRGDSAQTRLGKSKRAGRFHSNPAPSVLGRSRDND